VLCGVGVRVGVGVDMGVDGPMPGHEIKLQYSTA
jgi:hypothetical protein